MKMLKCSGIYSTSFLEKIVEEMGANEVGAEFNINF